jgi:hypothetical protein
MSLDNLILYGIGAILFMMAVLATYFIVGEISQLARDILRNRGVASDQADDSSAPRRRITPFKDRGTVERLIGYFTGQGKD